MAANGEINLGTAFNPAIFGSGNNGDVAFGFGLASGAFLAGQVTYVASAGVAGDYNGNGIVDAADYTIWRDHLGSTTFTLPNDGGISPGVVDAADYTFWKSRFGQTSGSGAGQSAGVPESSSIVLFACGFLGLGLLIVRRRSVSKALQPVAILMIAVLLANSCYANATKDRFYQFGDDSGETPKTLGQPPSGGSTFDSATINAGGSDFQDLSTAGGGPTYINTQSAPARPGAVVAGDLWGLQFDGIDDHLVRVNGGLGSPAIATTDVSYAGPPAIVYTGITTRLIDGWVKPTNAAAGHRQDIINDTSQFGIFISADNHWGFTEGTATVTTTAPVSFNTWTHVMHRTFTNASAVLYVNGVAVGGSTTAYNTAPAAGSIVFAPTSPRTQISSKVKWTISPSTCRVTTALRRVARITER